MFFSLAFSLLSVPPSLPIFSNKLFIFAVLIFFSLVISHSSTHWVSTQNSYLASAPALSGITRSPMSSSFLKPRDIFLVPMPLDLFEAFDSFTTECSSFPLLPWHSTPDTPPASLATCPLQPPLPPPTAWMLTLPKAASQAFCLSHSSCSHVSALLWLQLSSIC